MADLLRYSDAPMTHIMFEGVDGSGKSTVLVEVCRLLADRGLSAAIVGKRDDEAAVAMTELIVSRTIDLDPYAEATLRLAREHHRLSSAPAADVVLLDRGLPSLAAMIEVGAGLDVDEFTTGLNACRLRMPVVRTVLCAPPFAVARARVENRARQTGKPLSKKEARGYDHNERIGAALHRWAGDPGLSGELLVLDTAALDVERCALEATDFILAGL